MSSIRHSSDLTRLLVIIATLILTVFLGTLVGVNQAELAVALFVLGILAFLGMARWRLILLVIYPLTWAWTWVSIPFLPGISPERALAIPAFVGFLAEFVFHRRRLERLPFGSSIIMGVFVVTLIIGLGLNPTSSGIDRLIRLVQKVAWAYLIFDTLINSDERRFILFSRLLVASTLLAAIGGLLIVNEFGMNTRYTRVLGDQWRFASYGVIGLNLTAPVAFLLLADIGRARMLVRRLLLYGAFAAIVLGTVLTIARRETIIIVPVSLLAITLFSPGAQRARSILLVILGVLIFLLYVLPSSTVWQDRFFDDLLQRSTTIEEPRVALAVSGWSAFLERPLLGYGTGSAATVLKVQAEELALDVPGSSHSSFISMMVELGILGLGISIAIWISLFRGLLSALRQPIASPYLRQVVYVLPGIMTYALLRWFTGDALRYNPTWTLFGYFWAAIWLAHHQEQDAAHQSEPGPAPFNPRNQKRSEDEQ